MIDIDVLRRTVQAGEAGDVLRVTRRWLTEALQEIPASWSDLVGQLLLSFVKVGDPADQLPLERRLLAEMLHAIEATRGREAIAELLGEDAGASLVEGAAHG